MAHGMQTQKKAKHRAHLMLFAEGTPFKQKVVSLKNKYQRKPKHKNREFNLA